MIYDTIFMGCDNMNIYDGLTNILRKYNNILILTHKDPDLDGLSSSIAFHFILNHLNINNKFYINDDNIDISIKKALINLEDRNFIVNEINENYDCVLIIDTNKLSLLDDEIICNNKDIIVIDHHIKGNASINNSTYEICDSTYSSVSEITTQYLKHLNIKVIENVYTYLLAGMEIDTNEFSVRVSARTFHTAAYLLENGADIVLKQDLLKENRIEYMKQQYFIRKSFLFNENIMICTLDENIYEKKYLANISEEILQFEGIEAAFTIGNVEENIVGISARSIGNIDVEKIMESFNGGGHKTNAAAQISNITKEEVKKQLMQVIGG